MADIWVLVADSSRARVFEVTREDPTLREIAAFTNPEGRIAQRELRHDRLPRVNESMGHARHAIEPHTSLKQKITDRFVRTLRDELDRGHAAHRYKNLVLVAAPRFMGALHGALDDSLQKCVVAEVRHNLTLMSSTKIRERLPPRLA
jgi:protein required for attachment to host cells